MGDDGGRGGWRRWGMIVTFLAALAGIGSFVLDLKKEVREEDWKEMERRFELFRRLAPVWVETGLLLR